MFNYTATAEAPYGYLLYLVNSNRLTRECLVFGQSAQEVVEQAIVGGYVKAEAAPAAPVNGFSDTPHRSGDTASIDTRKAA